jgi:hypothetical protein
MGIRTRGESWLPGQGYERVGSLPVLGVNKISPLVGGHLILSEAANPVELQIYLNQVQDIGDGLLDRSKLGGNGSRAIA